ncbi:MAG: ABC transporter ATP-binding protein [Streptococcaceae bacterium]|jgi:oligopeptide transport system ATP-binding protein|nr:ABC transporter ATP-binding protein [Streptococcaceae bacterium]MCH4178024.1 ABC transporter ATP-binding protein [Streptococcaceae bacterium]
MVEKILKIDNLAVSFKTLSGTINAVRGVKLDLFEGETLALVGESGSGKSVSTKAITQLLSTKNTTINGEIIFNDKNLLEVSEKEMTKIRGKEIAMIFQDPMTSLNPTMKIGLQISESILNHEKVSKAVAKAKTIELMVKVGIVNPEVRFNQYPHEFSGGMRQRVMIALALACNPKILIADEPTTALDVTIQAQIIELIKEMKSEINLSTIFITHDLGVVANIADRVAVMYAGKIVEYGTANEIFYNPKHPYTWGLLASMPTLENSNEMLYTIPGSPPNLADLPKGDPFAIRNQYALNIDFDEEPEMFKVSDTHYAATWLLSPLAPKINPPEEIIKRQLIFESLPG